MLRKNNIIFVFVLSCLVFAFSSFVVEAGFWHDEDFAKEEASFIKMLRVVSDNYVEDIDRETLMTGVFVGMLASLDKYSQYLTKEMYRELLIQTRGKFSGIGIAIYCHYDFLEILSCIENSPAEKVGLKKGDKIVAVDSVSVDSLSAEEAILSLRGKKNSTVVLTVISAGETAPKDVSVIRDIVVLNSVKEPKFLADGTGYIQLVSFTEDTVFEFRQALKYLMDKGLETLIVDVRNNPGGVLDDSIKLLSFFIPSGKKLVEIKSGIKKQNYVFRSSEAGLLFNGPLAVIIDGKSASGAEIIAGVVQDIDRGVVLGETSFGKGSVQSIIPVEAGAALKITTGRYLLPSGKIVEGIGVTPDIKVLSADNADKNDDVVLQKAITVLQEMLLQRKLENKIVA